MGVELAKHREAERAQIANLVWTAKEAAAKVRREGLKLDLRYTLVTPGQSAQLIQPSEPPGLPRLAG